MFERFTERSRKVVVLAQEEAHHLRHNYIGTEHLLLGLVREEDGIASQVLRHLGVRLEEVRDRVESTVGYGEEDAGEQAPFTPRSKKILEMALRESMQLSHDYIGTEHLLLGLARETEGVAARVLSNLGVASQSVRRETLRALSNPSYRRQSGGVLGAHATGFAARARVSGLEATIGGQGDEARTLWVDLEYDYEVREADTLSGVVDHAGLVRFVGEVLEGRGFRVLEAELERLGERILERFPEINELTASITTPYEAGEIRAAGVTVEGTFRR